jgi:hypothetical protein
MAPAVTELVSYKSRLDRDGEWALSEGFRHFKEDSQVHHTLQRICRRLNELGIPYAVVGGMAMFHHGFRRFTEDVDLLVTRSDLKTIHQRLSGLGFIEQFEKSKHLKDVANGVKIEFLLTGDYPGDGKEKPVAFPDPADVTSPADELKFISLPKLIELKLASGMTGSRRERDLVDVQQLIETLVLPESFGTQLHPYVQPKFNAIWRESRKPDRRFVRLWRNKWLTAGAKSLDDMIATLQNAADTLRQMRDDGVTLEADGGTGDDYAELVTTDPEIAKKYDMHDESEYIDEDSTEAPDK